MNKTLNTIQNRAVRTITKDLDKSGKSFIRMATGTGKTEVMVKFIKKNKPERVLILAHLTDLIDNVFDRLHDNKIYDVGIFDGRVKDLDHSITVAGVQTIGRDKNLDSIPRDSFDLIIIDEAHHAGAVSYNRILKHFKSDVIGMTATPYRPDGVDLQKYFGPVRDIISFDKGQELEIIAKHKAHTILTDSFLEGATTINGDYSKATLGRLWDTNGRMELIAKSYIKYGRESVIKAGMKPKAICFCVNVQHARKMANVFGQFGIKSDFLVSDVKFLSADDRKTISFKFSDTNDIEIVCVVGLLGEGVNIPDANISLQTRPTKSAILYTQSVGRVSRIDHGNKKFFVILDYVDNCRRNFIPYTMSNIVQTTTNSTVITEYLKHPDSLAVDQRLQDLTKHTRSFEESQATRLTDEHLRSLGIEEGIRQLKELMGAT